MTTTTRPAGIPDIYNAVQELWEAGADNLDKGVLEWFAGSEPDGVTLRNLADTVERLAALAINDTGDSSKPPCGVFANSGNVGVLLATLAGAMRGVAALTLLRDGANDRLLHPDFYAAISAAATPAPKLKARGGGDE